MTKTTEPAHFLGGTRYTCNVGMEVMSQWHMTIGRYVTVYGKDPGGEKSWAPGPERPSRLVLQVLAPSGLWPYERVEFTAASGFDGALTMDRATAKRLGLNLGRKEIPLRSVWSEDPIMCKRAKCVIRIPSLGLEQRVTALVVPVDGLRF